MLFVSSRIFNIINLKAPLPANHQSFFFRIEIDNNTCNHFAGSAIFTSLILFFNLIHPFLRRFVEFEFKNIHIRQGLNYAIGVAL
jgi:hypothetical protein